MDEKLYIDARLFYLGDILGHGLARKHCAAYAHIEHGTSTVGVVDAHLRACVQCKLGQFAFEQFYKPYILYDRGVRAVLVSMFCGVECGLHLAVFDERIESYEYLSPEQMSVFDSRRELVVAEILRFCARAELRHTEVYRIRAVVHRGFKRGDVACRSYELHGQRSFAPNLSDVTEITRSTMLFISVSENVVSLGCRRIEKATLL